MNSYRWFGLYLSLLFPILPGALRAEEGAPGDPLLGNLEGADPEKGALAARDLLARIVDPNSEKRDLYLEYLVRALDPQAPGKGAPALAVAERLAAALGYTAASGQPYPPQGAELTLKLIGVGPESLRKVVHEAVSSFARAERVPGSPRIAGALSAMIQAEATPSPPVLREISAILWRIDGKALVRSLIAVVSRSKQNPRDDLAPCLFELRHRLDLHFATIEEWERWWAENQENPIEVILYLAHRQFRARNAELWRKVFRRLESPESCLGAIGDALDMDPTPELRAAAVEMLGAFNEQLRDGRFQALDDAGRLALASRGLGLLMRILGDGERVGFLHPEVRRKAFVALRSYAAHLARNPQDEAAVSGTLLAAFRSALPETPEGSIPPVASPGARKDLLEVVKTAGALRFPPALPFLLRIVQEEGARARSDSELVVEALGALGRVLERGASRPAVELLMKCFRARRELAVKEPGERIHRDITRACVSALNLRIEDPGLRDEVRRFYSDVLSSGEDKTCRVPAIIGLGILAKGGDREAVSQLAGVLERRGQYEPAEVTSVVDAIAYLGGQEALEPLLPFIDVRDAPLSEHLWRKVVSLLKGQGPELFRWTLVSLELRAFRLDRPDLIGLALRLAEESELAPILAPERANTANSEEFVAFWESSLLRIRALELLGQESRAAPALSVLKDLMIKNGRIKSIRPQAEEELARAQARIDRRAAALALLARDPPALPEAKAQGLIDVISPSEEAETRWRGLHWVMAQLQGLRSGPESARIAGEVLAALGDGRGQALWRELTPEVRARSLKSLEAIRDRFKASSAGPAGN